MTDQDDYAVWRAHFGESLSPAAAVSTAIAVGSSAPEELQNKNGSAASFHLNAIAANLINDTAASPAQRRLPVEGELHEKSATYDEALLAWLSIHTIDDAEDQDEDADLQSDATVGDIFSHSKFVSRDDSLDFAFASLEI